MPTAGSAPRDADLLNNYMVAKWWRLAPNCGRSSDLAFRLMRFCRSLFAATVLWSSAASAVSPFMVFFASSDTRVRASEKVMLDNAVATFGVQKVEQIEIHGHADRAGDPRLNQYLSERRAKAVAAALRKRGYAGSIRIMSHGEDQPLVATADGVAELQNRRAEVIMVCFPDPQPGFEYMRCDPKGNGS